MNSGYDQIVHGLLVGGIALPILAALIGLGISLLTGRSLRMRTVTRLVFVALGIGVAGAITSARIPTAEGVACLVAQLVAWLVLLGPRRTRRRKR